MGLIVAASVVISTVVASLLELAVVAEFAFEPQPAESAATAIVPANVMYKCVFIIVYGPPVSEIDQLAFNVMPRSNISAKFFAAVSLLMSSTRRFLSQRILLSE